MTRDWGGRVSVRPGVEVIVERNHHWGSRWGADRNRALWSAFTIVTPGGNIFFAGDTGWGDGSWVRAAAAHGPFRLAILPIGAYLPRDVMQTSHIGPVEAFRIFETLNPDPRARRPLGHVPAQLRGIDDPPRSLAALARAAGWRRTASPRPRRRNLQRSGACSAGTMSRSALGRIR